MEDPMEFIPIPYFGMIMGLLVAPALTFGFIVLIRKQKSDVDKLRLKKEIMEIELHKEELHMKSLIEENRKYDRLLENTIENKEKKL